MRTILLAVQEDSLRQQITHLVNELRPECAIEATGDAREARALAEKIKPEVVIADAGLSLGGMLELVRWLQREQPLCQVILVCELDGFEQVQRIVRPGSVDYLIRPFHSGDLARLLTSLQERIQAQRESGSVVAPLIEMGEADPVLSQVAKTLPALAAGTLTPAQAVELTAALPERRGVGMVVALHDAHAMPDEADVFKLHETAMTLESYLGGPSEVLISFSTQKPQLLALVLLTAGQQTEWVRERMMAATAHLQYGSGITLDVGVSLLSQDLYEYGVRAFEQANHALAYRFYFPGGSIVLYEDNQVALRKDLPFLQPLEQALEQAVQHDQLEDAKAVMDRIFVQLDSWPRSQPQRVLRHIHQLMQRLVQLRAVALGEQGVALLTEENTALLGACDMLDALHTTCHTQLGRLFTHRPVQLAMDACLDYLRVHCAESLTLETLASQFQMEPQALDLALMEKTGLPFSQYQRVLRIEMADRLLLCTSLPLHEIAARVGYSDPAYFCKVYQKVTGKVPESKKEEI